MTQGIGYIFFQNKMFQIKLGPGNYTGLAFDILNEIALNLNFR